MYCSITFLDPLTLSPGDASAMPAGVTVDDTLWTRVIGDGTTLRVKCINQPTPPSEAAWSNPGACYRCSDFDGGNHAIKHEPGGHGQGGATAAEPNAVDRLDL